MKALPLILLFASAVPVSAAGDVAKSTAPVAVVKSTAPAAAKTAAAPAAPRPAPEPSGVLAGIDVLEADGFQALKGKRIGLITNHTGLDRKGRSTVRVLAEAEGVQLKALFSPEHGFKGIVEDAAV